MGKTYSDVEAADIVSITDHGSDTVSFTVKQVFGASVGKLSVYYHKDDGSVVCDAQDSVAEGDEFDFTAYCVEGVSDISVHINIDGSDTSACSTCSAPDPNSGVDTAYYFKLDCEPVCVPEEPSGPATPAPQATLKTCYNGAEDETPASGHVCPSANPIEIMEQHDDHVLFKLTNTFGKASEVTLRYDPHGDHDNHLECVSRDLEVDEPVHMFYSASCVGGVTEVEVLASALSGSITGGSSLPSSCGDGNVECAQTFVLPCSKSLNCDETARRMESDPVVDEPSSDHEDAPYCLSEDFPCEGDEANMVYVCHYSARKGYQTFCVTEADSDILRFYANDYCGPCEGGQGVTWGDMIH